MGRKEIDMLNGSLWDKILLFALPLAVTGILQQLFNAVDVAVVGQCVNAGAMAAVGSNSPVIGLLVNLFVGISLGSNVVIANAIGMGDRETVSKTVHTSITVAFFGGLGVTLLGEAAAWHILKMMSVPNEVFDMALLYLRIYLLGVPVILLYNFESAVYRSIGNTKKPLITLVISGTINVCLNLLFVVVFKRSVDGVALATVVSNAVSAVILFCSLVKTESIVRIDPKKLRINLKSLKRILKIGVPSGVQSMTFSAANLVVQSAINSLGAVVMAGSAAAFNLEIFAYYVLNSFGQACTTFVGQNNGAGKHERCKKVLFICILENMIFTFSAIVLILFSGKGLLSLFNGDSNVIEQGYIRLMYIFTAYVFSLISDVVSGYLRGYGDSVFPAAVSLIGICGVRILWIKFIFPSDNTFSCIMTAYPVSLGITAAAVCLCAVCLRPDKRHAKI